MEEESKFVYPHSFDEIVLVVPNFMKEKSNLWEMVRDSPLLNVWFFTILLITIIRILIKKWTNANGVDDATKVLLETFGMSFGVGSSYSVCCRAEKTIVLFLNIFAILASIFCSGYLYQQYTSDNRIAVIQTLGDLNKSNLTILIGNNIIDGRYDTRIKWLKTL